MGVAVFIVVDGPGSVVGKGVGCIVGPCFFGHGAQKKQRAWQEKGGAHGSCQGTVLYVD